MKPPHGNFTHIFMVFDVESIGLHGEGFAVAYVVVTDQGEELDSAVIACPRSMASGSVDDREWVNDNVPPIPPTVKTPQEVRAAFFSAWTEEKSRGARLVADCGWPVEGRFLTACIDDDPSRKWDGPYPLLDLSAALFSRGVNPLEDRERLPSELPKHDPLADCRQSARLFIEAIRPIA